MEVLEMREELAEARQKKDLAKVKKLGEEMKVRLDGAEKKLSEGFAAKKDPLALLPALGEMRFYKRFLDEVDAIEEEADEA
jgi:molecular chaperone HscB